MNEKKDKLHFIKIEKGLKNIIAIVKFVKKFDGHFDDLNFNPTYYDKPVATLYFERGGVTIFDLEEDHYLTYSENEKMFSLKLIKKNKREVN